MSKRISVSIENSLRLPGIRRSNVNPEQVEKRIPELSIILYGDSTTEIIDRAVALLQVERQSIVDKMNSARPPVDDDDDEDEDEA